MTYKWNLKTPWNFPVVFSFSLWTSLKPLKHGCTLSVFIISFFDIITCNETINFYSFKFVWESYACTTLVLCYYYINIFWFWKNHPYSQAVVIYNTKCLRVFIIKFKHIVPKRRYSLKSITIGLHKLFYKFSNKFKFKFTIWCCILHNGFSEIWALKYTYLYPLLLKSKLVLDSTVFSFFNNLIIRLWLFGTSICVGILWSPLLVIKLIIIQYTRDYLWWS